MSNIPVDSPWSKTTTSFEHGIIREALKSKFANPKNKITDDAVELVSEIAKMLVTEATLRAAQQANLENKKKINLDHVEIVLPQLVCDLITALHVGFSLSKKKDLQ